MANFSFWRSYQEMILSIIEDKPRFDIPIIIFKIVILISFMQILMYLFSDFQLLNKDEFKLKSAFQICESVSLVNILNIKGSDSLSLFFYIVSQAFMYSYFIYVAFLTIAKEFMKEFYQRHKTTIVQTNEFLNIYFTFYLNVFLTQYIELNSSIIFCSKKSLLSNMRDQYYDKSDTTCDVPSWQVAIGSMGLVLAIATAFITNYYFRNYEFLEKNILKRKSTILFTILIIIRITITIIDFNGSIDGSKTAKHLLTQSFGIISIMDYFISIPFTDQEISRFYLVVISYYEGIVTCGNFYLLGNLINGQEMFYMCIIFSLVLSATLQLCLNYKYESILKGNWELEKIISGLDYYLEQIVLLGEKSGQNEESKIILQKAYKLHRSGCKIPNCFCRRYLSLNMKLQNNNSTSNTNQEKELTDKDCSHLWEKNINMRVIYKFVDSLFQWMFSQKCINQNTSEFEKLSLKYISFMMKYQNNPIRAFFELKVLQLKKSSFSTYFKMVTNIIGQNIQKQIEDSLDEESNERGGGAANSSKSKLKHGKSGLSKASMRNELTVSVIVDIELLCQKYINQFLKIIEQKFDLWVKLQNGYKSMNDFQVDAIKLMKQVRKLRFEFQREMKKVSSQNQDIENCLQYQKIVQIFYLFIANDTIKAVQLELQISELKKRDSLAEHDQLKNISMIKGDICILEVSLAQNFGQIVSKKDEKTAQFFGFTQKQDFLKINYINDLMPNFISRVHNQLMKNYLQGTSMRSKNGGNEVNSFIKLNDGYLFPVKVHFNFSFTSSLQDFRMNGILLKNRMEQDFILFHRNGKVVGMTKHIAKIFFQEFHSLPSGESAVNKLNALLLFPGIIKKLIQSKESIIKDLTQKLMSDQQTISETTEVINISSKSASSMTLLAEDLKGSLKFSSNPFSSFRKFFSFLTKKSQTSSGSQRQFYRYDEIDLLDRSCLKLLKQFDQNDFGQSTNRSHHDSSERLLSGRGDFGMFDDSKLNHLETNMQTINSQNKRKQQGQEYKMKFEYSLSYCLLDQKNKNQRSRMKRQNSVSRQISMGKQEITNDQFQDIYFALRIENISTKCREKKIKYKAKEKFIRNIITYLKSTTSLIQLSNQSKNLSQFKHTINSQLETTDDHNQDSYQNQKISTVSTQIIENLAPPLSMSVQEDFFQMPKKMVQLLQTNLSNLGIEDDHTYNIDNYQQESPQKKEDSSFKSSQTEDNSDLESEDMNYEKIYSQVMNQVYNNKQSRDAIDANNSDLDILINNFCNSKKNVITRIDPNYPIKKIIQKRSLSCIFGKALEVALTEVILQVDSCNNKQKLNISNLQNMSQLYDYQFQTIQKEDIQVPITFRQDQGDNISGLDFSIDRIPSNLINIDTNRAQMNTKQFIVSARNTYLLGHPPSQNNLDSQGSEQVNQIIQDMQNTQNQITYINGELQNTYGGSFIQHLQNEPTKQEVFDINQQKNNKNDQSMLDISARPILDQSNFNQLEQYQNEIINTPSVIDPNDIVFKKITSFNQDLNKVEIIKSEQDQSAIENKGTFRQDTENQGNKYPYQIQINQQDEAFFRSSGRNNQHDNKDLSIKNSSEKNDNEEGENAQEELQEQAIAKILNQKGMVNGKNSVQKVSVHSSSRTSNSYAGVFLKGILTTIIYSFNILYRSKIPIAAQQYKFILIIFLVSFVSLNITNLMIIQNDMQIFADNVIILRQPRKFLRAYGKTLYGYYCQIELQLGFLKDTPDKLYSGYLQEYIDSGIEEYKTLSETFSTQLTQLRQDFQKSKNGEDLQFQLFKRRSPTNITIDFSLLFSSQQFQILGLSKGQEDYIKIDSFLYLRQNYFQFSSEILDTVQFLVQGTLDAVDSLIQKFTIVIICAIFGIISVAIISLPVIKAINFYEEKIMMIVTRINYDQSEIEKCKLNVCQQLININYIDWLNYNYFDIFNISAQKNNDMNQSQSSKHHTLSNPILKSKSKSKQKPDTNKTSNKFQQSSNILNANNQSTTLQLQKLGESREISQGFFSTKPKIVNKLHLTTYNKQKEKVHKKAGLQGSKHTSYDDRQNSGTFNNNNYLLQSKIVTQNLRIFDRFLTLLVLTVFNCIYFLIIIIYLTQSNDQLKVPVQMNQRSITLHIIQINQKIATELLAFDFMVRDELWSDYQIDDLDKFYDTMIKSLDDIQLIQEKNTEIIYGQNPFPESIINTLKDIQEGRGCQYLTKYKCSSNDIELGLKTINSKKAKFITEYPEVLTPDKPDRDQLITYLNGIPHINEFILSFRSEDELFDIYSSTLNGSISTVSLSIQNFLQNYLIIGGTTFSIIIFIVSIINWKLLFIKLQEMNLLLTIIPEEKLQEDVTLHMIRQLIRM